MSEAAVIQKTPSPRTRDSLARELRQAGLVAGMTMIVHSSLSSLGWVCGGPVAVVQALMDVVTISGTIVMPTHTGDYSDPAEWQHPPVPAAWWPIIREAMPIFDPRTTPTRGMGQIVEVFRTCPGVLRSSHPEVSFAAWGRKATYVTDGHGLDRSLGESSPLARIYDLGGSVLLLGVGYDRNTSFHLAEYRTPGSKQVQRGAPIVEGEKRVWKVYPDIAFEDDLFIELGNAFEQTGHVTRSTIGSAEARLFSQPRAVDFAVDWLAARRGSVEK
jgi:aminoglycoside 3-N-acetyltransferase